MRMLQLRGEEDFALEAVHADAVRQAWSEDLNHDAPIDGMFAREVGAGHATAAEFPLERVAAGQRLLEARSEVVHHLSGPRFIATKSGTLRGVPKGRERSAGAAAHRVE